MKALVIGSGGREHAIAWRLAQCAGVEVHATPGNPGMSRCALLHPDARDIDAYLKAAKLLRPDFTVVGPEVPLVAGVVDRFRQEGLPIVGPTAAAAQLEGSKAFSKAFMHRNGIPTARFETATNAEEARAAVERFGTPVVLKADGLAAGKGVVIAHDIGEAERALPTLLASGAIVVEEFLQGEEVSFIVVSDGRRFAAFPPSQDHKAAYDGDRGPNTGGMGAYSDDRILTRAETREIEENVIERTIDCMEREGRTFSGFLYAGLMMTSDGARVLEFNTRLGDPETQALLHRVRGGFVELLEACAKGDLAGLSLEIAPEPSVCVVVAAHGYPGTVRTGDIISGIEAAEQTGCIVFHAGTRQSNDGLQTAGGRVLGVTASGTGLASAITNAYAGVEKIHFDGMHYRKDIGHKGLKRYNE